MSMLRGLYLITDETLTPYERIEEYLIPAFEGGTRILQLRDKHLDDEALFPVAERIQALCREFGVTFIINDRIDLANELNADGLHIGRDDEGYELARRILGRKKIIGVSCYGDLFRAKEMEHKGADYVAFGSFFTSSTKPQAPTISSSLMGEAKRMIRIPVCGIGGITAENASLLANQGADMLAVISDVWCAPDIKARCELLSGLFHGTPAL